MDAEHLQKLIRNYQAKLNWTLNDLANALYVELHDDDDLNKQAKFRETLKKQLQRSSTPNEKLKRYLQIIEQVPDFKRLNLVANKHIDTESVLSKKASSRLQKISIKLTERLEHDELLSEYDEL